MRVDQTIVIDLRTITKTAKKSTQKSNRYMSFGLDGARDLAPPFTV